MGFLKSEVKPHPAGISLGSCVYVCVVGEGARFTELNSLKQAVSAEAKVS